MDLFREAREAMVIEQVVARGVEDKRVLEAMKQVPREKFVNPLAIPFAYEDRPLSIEEGQTISQPFIVARMIEEALLQPEDRVLEIGTGSGYSTAVLSLLASTVYSIERHPKLAEKAEERLKRLGYTNIEVRVGDGTLGWDLFAPYDAIIVTAGAPRVPSPLLQQLKIGGRLVIPVGPNFEEQRLIRIVRFDEENFLCEDRGGVRFVPLIGQEGWKLPE